MRIFYGVQGTGNGHISRVRVMARHLRDLGADVTYLFSGREPEQYFDMEIFGNYLTRRGLTFSVHKGQINHLDTLRKNDPLQFINDVRTLDLSDYDLVLTDYEPVTAWAGRLQHKQVIGIGHQYAFSRKVPMEGDGLLSRLLLRKFAPTETSFGLHWSQFDQDLLPPIIDTGLCHQSGDEDRRYKIMVYLPFEDQTQVTALLQQLPEFRFYLYSPILENQDLGNVLQRRTCHDGFKRDLAATGGVICNAGFELVSECIHLGLSVLVKPLGGQVEQLSNARAIVSLGLGERMNTLNLTVMRNWLNRASEHRLQQSSVYPDVAKALAQWLMSENRCTPQELSNRLWYQVNAQQWLKNPKEKAPLRTQSLSLSGL